MKLNQWTIGLAAAGVISLASAVQAEEAASQVMTALSSTTLSGYVDTSAIWKLGTGNRVVGRKFDGANKQDGFNLNVVQLILEKPLDEGSWSAGYKLDVLFGPDAGLYNPSAVALPATVGGGVAPSLGDTALKQAYVALRAPVGNGLDIKMGVFDTVIGYEVFEAANNPNYSRSYGNTLEPTQHTGVLLSYRVTDWLSFSGGIANTYNAGINGRPARAGAPVDPRYGTAVAESEKTYMASMTLTAPESLGALQGAALYAGVVDGLNNALAATAGDTTSLYTGVTIPTPLEGLSVGAAYDYRASSVPAFPLGRASNYANAAAVYVTYHHDKWKFANRAEYTSGSNGTYYFVPALPGSHVNNEFFANTFTVDYSLWENVVSRVELRWDHSLKGRHGGDAPFGDLTTGGDKNSLSLALNVIYRF